MTRFDSFDELRRELETVESVRDAIALLDSAAAEVACWDEARCLAWIVRLVA